MSTFKIRLRGNEAFSQKKEIQDSTSLFELVESIEVTGSTRGDGNDRVIVLKEDEVVELNLTDETIWFGDSDSLLELFPQQFKRSAGENFLELPDFLTLENQDRSGLFSIGIKYFSKYKNKGKDLLGGKVGNLAKNLEDKQLSSTLIEFSNVNAGLLLNCDEGFELSESIKISKGKPVILFLHGTGSSTSGSFSKLKDSPSWSEIYQSYAVGNVLAFQHRTFTFSPLANVLELVKQLPYEIELDLVSHSRGGLIADVLARFVTDARGFDELECKSLKDSNRDVDLEIIKNIQNEIKKKKIILRKIVRVACPANGTTLASKRLNLFLNVSLNFLGSISGQATNPIFHSFRELVMTTVQTKDNVDALPGIEAMNPDSPFVKALNYPGSQIKVTSELRIVGGSSQASLRFKGLLVLAGKFFFRRDNDLVVDTESMKWGAPREEGKVSFFIESSTTIDHLSYFDTATAQEAIFRGITGKIDSIPSGYVQIKPSLISDKDRAAKFGIDIGKLHRDKVSGKKPIVIILPGIMGSNLTVNEDVVWINYFRFLSGQLTRLENNPKGNTHIRPHSLIKTSYGKLADQLQRTYDVVTFPYDWRLSLLKSAEIFQKKIEELLAYNQPIKIVAHSMGGVLVRDFILNHEKTWKKLNGTPGFRVIFLGSPLGGSFRIPYVLFGQDDIIKLLAKIDISNTPKDLLKIFSNFPGLLNLLPIQFDTNSPDFSKVETWEKMRDAFTDKSWPIPEKNKLDEFGEYQALVVNKSKNIDYSNIVYVAGQSRPDKETICKFEIEEGKLQFFGTNEGDESVTWSSGIPQQLLDLKQYYYCNFTHGGLSTEAGLFAAIEEILIYGRTSGLQNSLPKLRGKESQLIRPVSEEIYDLSEENIEKVLLGLHTSEQESEMPIRVSVTHGDLKYAKYPVLAGHFEYDAILTTEKSIDNELNKELTRLLQLGLYPGPIGTNQIVLVDNPDKRKFKGAVIIGMGEPGSLSSFQLSLSIEKGVSRYLTILNLSRKDYYSESESKALGISVIALANSYGGLTTDSSIRAIILGIQRANQNINNYYEKKLRVIEEIEIIELFHDKALSILKTIKNLEEDNNDELKIIFQQTGLLQSLGRRHRIPFENSSDWWTRISVSKSEKPLATDWMGDKIKMCLATNSASERVEDLLVNAKNLETLLSQMTEDNKFAPDIAKTMFELLIPQNFKDDLKRQKNISWIVDEMTASFPWEMLQENVDTKPLSINSGMVRQLATKFYRRNITTVNTMTALVVGDPILNGFATQLPQAKKEGENVSDLLRANSYSVESLIASNPSQILLKLFSKDYKIIHLAGHGVFSSDPSKPTGMLIGDGSFLTVQEIAQMSTVPELVFVNCCYLGKSDRSADQNRHDRNKLAANIGIQLIENGVKAVVVAGWAVEDSAALAFCEEFYRQMFKGIGFGESVKRARKIIYDGFKTRTNTWGAFQCYGDPFYKLTGRTYTENVNKRFLVREEVEIELLNLIQQLDSKNISKEKLMEELSLISQEVKKTGIQSEKIIEYQAELYSKLDEYDKAVQNYELLLGMDYAGYSFRAMEQYCNISCKQLLKEFERIPDKEKPKHRKEVLDNLDNKIEKLQGLMAFGATEERLSLLGSSYKRKMMIFSGNEEKEILIALKNASDAYYKASQIAGFKFYYPVNNWIQLEKISVLLTDQTKLSETKKKFGEILDQIIKVISAKENKSFWDFAASTNCLLSKFMLGLDGVKTEEVIDSYKDLWARAGSPGQVKAEIEHLNILLKGLALAKSEVGKELYEEINKIKNGLLIP